MRIHFLSSRKFRSHGFSFPVRVFSRFLKQHGLKCKIFFRDDGYGLFDCDVLFVLSDHFGLETIKHRPEVILEWLRGAYSRVNSLIWADVADGAGMLFVDGFAEVDLYAKKQLLKDRQLYAQSYRSRSYHTHFYYAHFSQELAELGPIPEYTLRGLHPHEIDQLSLSWNIGLGDYNLFASRARSLRIYWPWANFADPLNTAHNYVTRPVDISYRVGMNYGLKAVQFHRMRIRDQLEALRDKTNYVIRHTGHLKSRAYFRELVQARIIPSPFGLGEICWRDFEAWLSGCVVLKPDMNHLETWPNYYRPGKTYVPFRWDFSDFYDTVVNLLNNPEVAMALAVAAQTNYLSSLEDGTAFAMHLKAIAKQALIRRTS